MMRFAQPDLARITELLRSAMGEGDPFAAYALGTWYCQGEKGLGIGQDPRRAFLLYMEAALRGDKDAVFEVRRCYTHGIGIDMDTE